MPRSPRNRLIGLVASGVLLGGFGVLWAGPIPPFDREGRLVVDGSYVESVRDSRTEVLGRTPDPGELARALDEEIDSDIFVREARVRGLVPANGSVRAGASEGYGSGPVRHLRRVAATRWLAAPPTEAEVIAFVELRRDRYAALVPGERGLPPAGQPEWESDQGLAELLAKARADLRTAERLASTSQFLAEIAPRHPIALSRDARAILDAGAGPEGAPFGGDAGAPATDLRDGGEGRRPGAAGAPAAEAPSAWAVDPGASWSGAASLFLEEAGEGRYDLTVLLPPGTGDDEVGLGTACGSDQNRTVIPVFAAHAGASEFSWRVRKGSIECPAGAALYDDELRVSAPAGVRGDLEFRRLDGAAFVSTFEGGDLALDLGSGGLASRSATREGRRGFFDVLGILALWALGLTLGSVRPGVAALAPAAAGFGIGYGLGRWTAGTGGPTIAFGVPEILALLAAATLTLVWASPRGGAAAPRPFGPSVGLLGLLGLAFGGTVVPSLDTALSQAGGWIDEGTGFGESMAGGAGAALALVPMIAAGVGLASLPGLGGGARSGDRPSAIPGRLVRRILGVGIVAGIVALAYSAFVAFPAPIPGAQLDAWVLAGALGALLPLSGVRVDGSALATAGLLLVFGLALPAIDGWGGYSAPFMSGMLVAGCILAAGLLCLGTTPAAPERWRGRALLGVGALGSFAIGLHLSWGTGPSGAATSSSALGGAAVALTLGWLAVQAGAATPPTRRTRVLRGAALAAVALAVAIRLPDYLGSLTDSVRDDVAFGRLPVPLLALTVGVVALVLMPRRRRVADALGIQRRTGSPHLWLAAAAFLLLPFGWIHVPLPLQAGGVPAEEDARRIVGQLLTDTYEAFDLADEEALYDRLAETVTGELLPTLFLENRRGLASGAGDATEVTLLDVAIAPGGVVSEARGAGRAFTWTGEWAVSARVAHLVHVHLRQNLYTGRVVVRADPEGWKLDAVELTAEERVARPWGGA